MGQGEETKIDITTTTTHTKIYDITNRVDDPMVKKLVKARFEPLILFLPKKLGLNKIVWVIPLANEILKLKAKAAKEMYNQNVIAVERNVWETFTLGISLIHTNYIFIGWERADPLEDWIKRGVIKRKHYIMATGKDPSRKELFKNNSQFIETWVNAQHQMGIKFPDCDRFHLMSEQFYNDPDVTFKQGEDDCSCGIKGKTFQV